MYPVLFGNPDQISNGDNLVRENVGCEMPVDERIFGWIIQFKLETGEDVVDDEKDAEVVGDQGKTGGYSGRDL